MLQEILEAKSTKSIKKAFDKDVQLYPIKVRFSTAIGYYEDSSTEIYYNTVLVMVNSPSTRLDNIVDVITKEIKAKLKVGSRKAKGYEPKTLFLTNDEYNDFVKNLGSDSFNFSSYEELEKFITSI